MRTKSVDQPNIESWLAGLRPPKTPRQFTPGARYRGRILDLKPRAQPRDRGEQAGFSFELLVRVQSLLVGGAESEPEGYKLLERLDFGPQLQPLDGFTRAVVAPLDGSPLSRLIGQWAEFTLGGHNPFVGYQQITTWDPVPAPLDRAHPRAGPCFIQVKGGFQLRYPADGPELVPFNDMECLRYCHRILAAAGRIVSPADLIRSASLVRPSDKYAVRAAVGSGEIVPCGCSDDAVFDDKMLDATVARVIRLTMEAADARTRGNHADAVKAEGEAEGLSGSLSRDLKKSAAEVFNRIRVHLLSGGFSEALAEAHKFGRMKNRSRSCAGGGATRHSVGSVHKVMQYAWVAIKGKGLPGLAEHLEESIRTRDGGFRYEPGGESPRWTL